MNFSEFDKSNPLFCLINFVVIQHIRLMVQVRNNSSWKLIFFSYSQFFIRSFAFYFHEKLLLQCHTSDNLFNCLVEHAEANKSGAVGVDFHSCPEQHMDQQRVKKLSLFPVICHFSHYRNTIYLKPVSGAFCIF